MTKKKKWVGIAAVAALGLVIAGVLIVRMNGPGTGRVPAFLPGIYTCQAQNKFFRISDTLVIRRTKVEEDDYAVSRGTCFVRIRLGKEGSPEYQRQQWTGHYDAKKLRLVSSDEADTVRYFPENNRVSNSDFFYEKIE